MLSVSEKEYIEAAIAQGASDWRLMRSEILPNVITTVIVFYPLMIATTMLTEAALSFLSIGVQPPAASWGTIIGDGQDLLYTRPWVAIAPGIAIVIVVLTLNVFGDGLRDALDPRAKLRDKTVVGRGAVRRWRLMIAFIVRRLVSMVFVMFAISVLTYAIFFATPGVDPAARIAGRNADPATLAAVKHDFGLDRPVPDPVRADDEEALHQP